MEGLRGQVIDSIYLNDSQDTIVFEIHSGQYGGDRTPLAFETIGDCCSCSYFNDSSGIKNLLGNHIVSVESIEEPHKTQESEYETIQFYGVRFKTHYGSCDLVYRNESNGYYGGWHAPCAVPKNYKNWKKITEDFN